MKTNKLIVGNDVRNLLAMLALGLSLNAQAALYSFTFNSGFANFGNVPDGNLNGWTDQQNLSGILHNHITEVQVKLKITGGYNGDLYAYISHDNVLIPLLNRVGVGTGDAFGSSDSGFDVTFTTTGSDVHLASAGGGQLTGTYQADGRQISPISAASAFDAAGTIALSAYNDLNPNGDWFLFVADVSGGGGTSHINSWEVDIAAVPEPSEVALEIFTALTILGGAWRAPGLRRLVQKSLGR
jgi:subtilisin-like proprotein convertase family protein